MPSNHNVDSVKSERKISVFRIFLVLILFAAATPFIVKKTSTSFPKIEITHTKVDQPKFLLVGGDVPEKVEFIATHYDMAVWHDDPQMKKMLPAVRKKNPNFVAIMYREAFCVLEKETYLKESVGHYDWISENHPEWFQLDSRGRRVEVPDYPGRWMMDFANPGWQDFWIEQTLQDVIAGGWDGVFADDVLTNVKAHDLPRLNKYVSDKALQEAVTSFLERAYPEFQKAGKLFIANVSSSYKFQGLWEAWLDLTDGMMEEHFAGDGWTWGDDVAENQLFSTLMAAKKDKWVLNLTYGTANQHKKMMTSFAAHLVSAGDKAVWYYRPNTIPNQPNWDKRWESSLGKAVRSPEVYGNVWVRAFERGYVVVNPSVEGSSVEIEGRKIHLDGHQGKILNFGS